MTIAVEAELTSDASHIVLEGMSWKTCQLLLRDFDASGQRKRITYNEGRMVIVSPLLRHERWKSVLGRCVETIADEHEIEFISCGSTTWKQKRRKRGLEPDECFYIQHEQAMRDRLESDLTNDPPPDLAIEVDLRPYLQNKLEVHAGLAIPEVWCFDGFEIETFVLQQSGGYLKMDFSIALPFLKPSDLRQFLDLVGKTPQRKLLRDVRKWSRDLKA